MFLGIYYIPYSNSTHIWMTGEKIPFFTPSKVLLGHLGKKDWGTGVGPSLSPSPWMLLIPLLDVNWDEWWIVPRVVAAPSSISDAECPGSWLKRFESPENGACGVEVACEGRPWLNSVLPNVNDWNHLKLWLSILVYSIFIYFHLFEAKKILKKIIITTSTFWS